MNRRIVAVAAVAGLIAVGIGAFAFSLRVARHLREAADLDHLRERRDVLRDSLAAYAARDPVLRFAAEDSSAIAVALTNPVVVSVLRRVASRYLDRVEIDLRSDVQGHGLGDFEVDAPVLGKIKVGEWKIEATVTEMKGVLSALPPSVSVGSGNRMHVALPVRVLQGRGSATLHFQWDSKSVFNLLCHDFETTQAIRGTVLPQEHVLRGDVLLSAGERGIVADPEFPVEKFPIAMDLAPESWEQIRGALKEQDKLGKCGLLMKPDVVIERLRALGIEGLRFRLPRRIFRTFTLPASLTQAVIILSQPVQISVRPHALRITPEIVWYGADIDARRTSWEGPPPPPDSSVAD